MKSGGNLQVQLIEATDLKSADIFGKSDPYAILKCSGQSFQTNTAKGQGSSPQWNQNFAFHLAAEDVGEEATLFVKVFDKDHVLGSDDFIGTARVPLAGVFAKHQELGSYDVILPTGKARGQVKLSMKYEPVPDA